jgi:hypothetical protein
MIVTPTFAQSGGGYNIEQSAINGGGVTFHTGGGYRLGGTVGQHDAGMLSGGGYRLTGGFWSPVAAPGNVVWNADVLSPDRATRSLAFRVEAPITATEIGGQHTYSLAGRRTSRRSGSMSSPLTHPICG